MFSLSFPAGPLHIHLQALDKSTHTVTLLVELMQENDEAHWDSDERAQLDGAKSEKWHSSKDEVTLARPCRVNSTFEDLHDYENEIEKARGGIPARRTPDASSQKAKQKRLLVYEIPLFSRESRVASRACFSIIFSKTNNN